MADDKIAHAIKVFLHTKEKYLISTSMMMMMHGFTQFTSNSCKLPLIDIVY